MAIGLVGQKCGMTRVFTEDGMSIPVTVIHVGNNRVTRIKTATTDGYNAVQVTAGERKQSRVNKPEAGEYAKAGVTPGDGLWEFPTDSEAPSVTLGDADASVLTIGSEITVSLFKSGDKIDVSGITKGKGFAGTVKRHNFATQDATHGNSRSHRVPGSIGQNQTPGRVFKGKRMAGHMGDVRRTVQNLEVVRIDVERGLLLVKGAVPGAKTGRVIVKPAVKTKAKVQEK